MKDKLTQERHQVIIEALAKHNYISTACNLAGIDEGSYYHWMDKAEAYENRILAGDVLTDKEKEQAERFVKFFQEVKQARAGSEAVLLGRIDKAGSEPSLIERRTIEHRLKDGTAKQETIERWSPAQWQANSWILERTNWQKYGQHTSLDIEQKGVVLIERINRARNSKVIESSVKVEQITKEAIPEEIPPQGIIKAIAAPPGGATAGQEEPTAKRRPIFELISKRKAVPISADLRTGQDAMSYIVQCTTGTKATSNDDDEASAAPKPGGGGRLRF